MKAFLDEILHDILQTRKHFNHIAESIKTFPQQFADMKTFLDGILLDILQTRKHSTHTAENIQIVPHL